MRVRSPRWPFSALFLVPAVLLVALTQTARAQTVATAAALTPAVVPPIEDNSFLIEEAYNQPDGVVQHVSTFARNWSGPGWVYTFTQEWPMPGKRHQLSYTLPVQQASAGAGRTGVGDVLINYRVQAAGMATGATRLFAPRLTFALPTGSSRHGLGVGAPWVQVNLPATFLVGDFALHSNAGATAAPGSRNMDGQRAGTHGYFLGQSAIWLMRPDLNFMVEALWSRTGAVVDDGEAQWGETFLVAPGVRGAFNFPSGLQIVPGLAFPIGVGPSRGENGFFLYLSIEHAFSAAGR